MKDTHEIWVPSLELEMATYSSVLAWKIPWTEEPSGLQSITKSQTQLSTHAHMHLPLLLRLIFLPLIPGNVKLSISSWKNKCWFLFPILIKALEIQSSTTKKTIFFISSSNFSQPYNDDNSSQFFLHIPVLYNILGDKYSFRSIVLLKIIYFQYILDSINISFRHRV